MAVKRGRKKGQKRRRWHWASGHGHGPGGRERHKTEAAARLTPLEETEAFKESHQIEGGSEARDDTIRVDSSTVMMPEALIEEERDASSTFRLDPVVLAIAALFLAFTAFIAWQITLMPPATK